MWLSRQLHLGRIRKVNLRLFHAGMGAGFISHRRDCVTPDVKGHSINISASGIVSWIGVATFAWLFAKPLLISSVSVALADDIKQTVAAQVAPINGAFVALLQRDINATKKEIATLEFRERTNEDWTSDDAEYLAEKEIELDALLSAKKALEATT